MTIGSRLKKLEQLKPSSSADAEARSKLAESLLSDYQRHEDQPLSAEWLGKQSTKSVLAFGMHHPLPLPECLQDSLHAVSNGPQPAAKIASQILEVAV